MASQGYDSQAAQGYASTTHPELQATNPNTTTPAAHEKKGIAEKVKGLLGGHGHKTTDANHQQGGVYGDATPTTGNAESTRVGCLDKIKAKAGVGHGLAPEQARAHGTSDPSASPDFNGGTNVHSSAAVHGGWPHPTNPRHMESAYGQNPNQPTAAGGYGVGNPNQTTAPGGYGVGNPDQAPTAGGYNVHNPNQATTATGYGVGNPEQAPTAGGYGVHNPNHATTGGDYGVGNPNHATTATDYGVQNPNQTPATSGYGDPQPTNPTGVTNAQGGAILGDHGNLHEGPRDDTVKKEGFVSKIMDKLHSPKGKPTHDSTTPNPY